MPSRYSPAFWLIQSRLFMALCAWAQTQQTRVLLGEQPQITWVSVLVFGGTWAVYAFHDLYNLRKFPDRKSESFNIPRVLLLPTLQVIIILCLLLTGIAALFLPRPLIGILLLPALLTLLYVLPLGRHGKRLRDLPLIKTFVLAVVWVVMVVALPAVEVASETVFAPSFIWLMLERALFVFAIALLFDVRDQSFDRQHGVLTFPTLFGNPNTRAIAIVTVLCSAIIAWWIHDLLVASILTATCLCFTALAPYAGLSRNRYFYLLGLDGLLLLQAAALVLAIQWVGGW